MRLEPLLDHAMVLVIDEPASKEDVLRRLAEQAVTRIHSIDAAHLAAELEERERRIPTSTPEGVAFPHAMLPAIDDTIVVPALVRPGVDFGTEAHPPSDVLFGMFGCSDRPFSHVRLLARLSRVARGPGALERFRKCTDQQNFYDALIDEDRKHG